MITLLHFSLIVIISFPSYSSAELRLALVIGNGAYSKEAALKTPLNDAQLMADTLRHLNFELFGGGVHVNVTQTQMRRLIRGFTQQLDRQSVGLFYYSGHGMQVDNRNYILPVDAEIEDRVDVRVQGVSIDEEVLWRMGDAKPIISIILLDACRNNPFEKRVKSLGASKGLGDMSAERGSIIGFASEPNTVAYESKGKYSYFTEALAREIVSPGIDITQVLRHVRVAVRDATNGEQIPTTREVLFDVFYPLPVNVQIQPRSDINDKKGASPPPTPQLPPSFTNSIGMEFVLIPAGEFMMGSLDTVQQAWDGEKPMHRVTISKPFYMGKYEVTQAQWQAVMGDNPSQFEGANRPVENVSWEDVQTFIRTLNQKAGYEVCRLPTEAQWEYAARAGSTTIYHFSDDPAHLGDYAWYEENSGDYTHSVGQKKPNAWGLYDMHGNVHEWVQDWYHKTYYQNSPTVDPRGPDTGVGRVVRGGSWRRSAQYVRVADRSWYAPGSRVDHIGFRCASSGESLP